MAGVLAHGRRPFDLLQALQWSRVMSIIEDTIGVTDAPDAEGVNGEADASEPAAETPVWDLPVRIFHWSLAAAFLAAFVTNRLGVTYFKYHVWTGYLVIVLVGFRLLWGFVGTRHALFRNFVRPPREILAYVRGASAQAGQHFAGHNPAGALMVLALLAGAGVQAITGLFANDEIINVGPLYGYVTKDQSLALTSVHSKLFYLLLAAIAAHVLAVVAHKVFRNENLARAMITGRKPVELAPPQEAISSSRLWLAAPLALGVAAVLAWVILHAPHAVVDTEF
jgi:cytochrome b